MSEKQEKINKKAKINKSMVGNQAQMGLINRQNIQTHNSEQRCEEMIYFHLSQSVIEMAANKGGGKYSSIFIFFFGISWDSKSKGNTGHSSIINMNFGKKIRKIILFTNESRGS